MFDYTFFYFYKDYSFLASIIVWIGAHTQCNYSILSNFFSSLKGTHAVVTVGNLALASYLRIKNTPIRLRRCLTK